MQEIVRKNNEDQFIKEIEQEVQEHLQVNNINNIFILLGKAKHGSKSNYLELTPIEKLLFCLEYGHYSNLERGFIRKYKKKPTNAEKNVYVRLCNETNPKDKESLKERKPQDNLEYQVIVALLSVMEDRSVISRTINPWLKIVLEVETLPDYWAIVEMLRQKCQ
jgi:hypothetical protein